MAEDLKQKEMRLKKELAKIRTQNATTDRVVKKNRDYDIAGVDARTTHKATHGGAEVPDVVLLPKKKRNKKENIPF
jgi:hypothetical protein|tara:strand:- start:606 stop:833 length:228 start_codon:yes stop_codon:yes gene_type:complete